MKGLDAYLACSLNDKKARIFVRYAYPVQAELGLLEVGVSLLGLAVDGGQGGGEGDTGGQAPQLGERQPPETTDT